MLLADEISRVGETLSFSILILGSSSSSSSRKHGGGGGEDDDEVLAEAVVELWVMVEDSINIARQVLTPPMIIGCLPLCMYVCLSVYFSVCVFVCCYTQ